MNRRTKTKFLFYCLSDSRPCMVLNRPKFTGQRKNLTEWPWFAIGKINSGSNSVVFFSINTVPISVPYSIVNIFHHLRDTARHWKKIQATCSFYNPPMQKVWVTLSELCRNVTIIKLEWRLYWTVIVMTMYLINLQQHKSVTHRHTNVIWQKMINEYKHAY